MREIFFGPLQALLANGVGYGDFACWMERCCRPNRPGFLEGAGYWKRRVSLGPFIRCRMTPTATIEAITRTRPTRSDKRANPMPYSISAETYGAGSGSVDWAAT